MISFYSVWPTFVGLALIYALVQLPVFSVADEPPGQHGSRLRTLDGLRGLLALLVVFHHSAIYHVFLTSGDFLDTPSRFYNNIGPAAVALFFMITSYLFWSRLLRHRGHADWSSLYIARVFRIGPLFLFAFTCMACIALAETRFRLQVPILTLARQLSVACGLGLSPIKDINGFPRTILLLDGVPWTLQYEWSFYLSLPLLAILLRRSRFHLHFVIGGIVCCIVASLLRVPHTARTLGYITMFFCGMFAASMKHDGIRLHLSNKHSSIAVLLLFCVTLAAPVRVGAFFALPLGLLFYLVASGCTMFGLLVSRPAIRLGSLSYSIYLLQGFPQALAFRVPVFRAMALASPTAHWTLALVASVLLLSLSTLTYVAIELPGIELGHKLARRARSQSSLSKSVSQEAPI